MVGILIQSLHIHDVAAVSRSLCHYLSSYLSSCVLSVQLQYDITRTIIFVILTMKADVQSYLNEKNVWDG